MSNKLLEFSEKLAEKKKENSVKFYLGYTDNHRYSIYGPYSLIELDEEDLNYFKNKYLPKMEDEYQANLAELNSKYGKA